MQIGGGANLAQITGTRLDSAAKHQIAVRNSYDHLLTWMGFDQMALRKEKMAFSVAVDDMVIGVGKPVRKNESHFRTANKAYPLVVTTLARMERAAKNYLIYLLHNPVTHAERDEFVMFVERRPDHWAPNMNDATRRSIAEMPDFYFCGVSVGFAHAHTENGDNTCTSFIGGLKTIVNGAFDVCAGDVIQWYWSCETNCFDADGRRHPPIPDRSSAGVDAFIAARGVELTSDAARRKAFYERGNGIFTSAGIAAADTAVVFNGKREVAFPKPLRPSAGGTYALSDTKRAFGKALCSAKAFAPLDIMIGRQSM